jgi:hypothetical protein
MSKYQFSLNQRHAVYKVNDHRCQWCGKPLEYLDFHVDHILPEELLNDDERLKKVKASYGLDDQFDINNYENWIPAHPNCNHRKSDSAYDGLPIIKTILDKSIKLKSEAVNVEEKLKNEPKKAKVLVQLQKALENKVLSEEDVAAVLNKNMEAFDELSEDSIEAIKALIEEREEYQEKKRTGQYMETVSKANSDAIIQLKQKLGEDWVTGVRLSKNNHQKDSQYTFHKYLQNKYDKRHDYDLRITPSIEAGSLVARLRFGHPGADYETFYIQPFDEPLNVDEYKAALETVIRAAIARTTKNK